MFMKLNNGMKHLIITNIGLSNLKAFKGDVWDRSFKDKASGSCNHTILSNIAYLSIFCKHPLAIMSKHCRANA